MSNVPQEFAEQLSAFMDGELPDAEARFLLRRLEHDAELRAAWERMQLASQCLRSQAWRPMSADFSQRVAAEIERVPAGNKHGWMRWAVAASVLALGLVMAPRLLNSPGEAPPSATLAAAPAASAEHIVPSPASADLVALREAAPARWRPALHRPRRDGKRRAFADSQQHANQKQHRQAGGEPGENGRRRPDQAADKQRLARAETVAHPAAEHLKQQVRIREGGEHEPELRVRQR